MKRILYLAAAFLLVISLESAAQETNASEAGTNTIAELKVALSGLKQAEEFLNLLIVTRATILKSNNPNTVEENIRIIQSLEAFQKQFHEQIIKQVNPESAKGESNKVGKKSAKK